MLIVIARVLAPILLLLSCILGKCQEISNLYYLCIGSGHYDFNPMYSKDHAFIKHEQLPEAINSSNIMTEIITRYGQGKGITLNSTKKKLITKQEILSGLEDLYKLIEKEKKPNPFVIIYYCGHGFVDGLVGSQFLLSGTYPRKRENDKVEERIDQNMYLLELMFLLMMKQPSISFFEMDKFFSSSTDPFKALGMLTQFFFKIKENAPRWILLLDCCRNPLTEDGLNMEKLQQNYTSLIADPLASAFGAMTEVVNEFYNNTFSLVDPILFSGKNMQATPVISYPQNDLIKSKNVTEDLAVGPICGKTLFILDSTFKNNQKELSLKAWLRLITSPSGEERSRPNTTSDINNTVEFKPFLFLK